MLRQIKRLFAPHIHHTPNRFNRHPRQCEIMLRRKTNHPRKPRSTCFTNNVERLLLGSGVNIGQQRRKIILRKLAIVRFAYHQRVYCRGTGSNWGHIPANAHPVIFRPALATDAGCDGKIY